MCLILDANVAHKFTIPPHADVKPVVVWFLNRKHLNRAALGGKLREELQRAGEAIRRFLAQLKRAGRLHEVPDADVDGAEAEVSAWLAEQGFTDADDPHIIALAQVSGSRLLVSADAGSGLHDLFKDRRLLKPPGKIYQTPKHRRLLWRAPKCK